MDRRVQSGDSELESTPAETFLPGGPDGSYPRNPLFGQCHLRLQRAPEVGSGTSHQICGLMERETGIEPVTSSLGSWRSTAELLPLNFVRLPFRSILDNVPDISHSPCVCLSLRLFVRFAFGTCIRIHFMSQEP